MAKLRRWCGDREGLGPYWVVYDISTCKEPSYVKWGRELFNGASFGFLEGPTWADDMIRKGLFPPSILGKV